MRFSLVFRIMKHFFIFEFDVHCFVLSFLLRISSNTHSLNILYFAVHPLVPLL